MPIPPGNTIYKNAKLIGNFGDDWQSTSSNKVADIQPTPGNDFLFDIVTDWFEPSIFLQLYIGRWIEVSTIIPTTTIPTIHKFSLGALPDGTSWTLADVNGMQIAVSSGGQTKVQSFQCFPHPEFLNPITIIEAGCEIEVSNEFVFEFYKVKVRPFRKFFKYVEN